MSLKNQKTTAEYIDWNQLQVLLLKLERDNEIRFCLLLAIGCYTGLRISDLLTLTWNDLLSGDSFELIEKKTKKHRKIYIHTELQQIVKRLHTPNKAKNELIFINKYKTGAMSVQYVNRRLKEILSKYEIHGQFSSHTFRKTLGRRVYSKNGESDKSLLMLSKMFNHANTTTTRRYLGITEQEISNIYLNL